MSFGLMMAIAPTILKVNLTAEEGCKASDF